MNSTQRLEKIVNYIIGNHNRKTHSRNFTSIMCVSGIPTLTDYYDIFYKKKIEGKHNLKIATIFTYQANEDDKDATGFIEMKFLILNMEWLQKKLVTITSNTQEINLKNISDTITKCSAVTSRIKTANHFITTIMILLKKLSINRLIFCLL